MASIVISLMLSQNRYYNKRIIGKNKKDCGQEMT